MVRRFIDSLDARREEPRHAGRAGWLAVAATFVALAVSAMGAKGSGSTVALRTETVGSLPGIGGPARLAEPVPGATRTFSGIEMVWIPPGQFWMGSPRGEQKRDADEHRHRVTLTKGFWLGKYEVTQSQWEAVTGTTVDEQRDKTHTAWPLLGKGPDHPMYYVSWQDCREFIEKLNGQSDGGFRMPTEAEWEYACRAGSAAAYCFGDTESRLDEYAWYDVNSGSETHPVGDKKANAWGLYDVHGNVWEWCSDWYGAYPTGSVSDPSGPSSGSARIPRGGAWGLGPGGCRSAARRRYDPDYRSGYFGLRLCR